MNKLIAIVASALLIITAANWFFYYQQSQDLNDALDEVSTLGQQITSIESAMSSLSADISGFDTAISSLEGSVLGVTNTMTSLVTAEYAVPYLVNLLEPVTVIIDVSTRTSGAGVIIAESGLVLTNSHVIADSSFINIILSDGQSYTATVVNDDPDLDLAILQITSERNDFPTVVLGDYESIVIGEKVIAIGFPYADDLGDALAVTMGIVSGFKFVDGYEYIQSDAEISLGFGGGPLVNMQGEVIGISTWGFIEGEGIGFSIPVNAMKDFILDTTGVIN